METTYDTSATSPVLFSESSTYCLGNTLEYIREGVCTTEPNEDSGRKNIEALLGILEDDLLDKGEFFNKLRNYAIQKTGDFQLAEDAVANFYCNVVRIREGELSDSFKYPLCRENGIAGNPELRKWAYACIKNSSTDIIRKKNSGIDRKISRGCDVNKGIPTDLMQDPQETAMKKEMNKIINQGMKLLDEPHREVIQLCYFEGLRFREAAEVLVIPLGTVKSRMHAALIDLREILKNYRDLAA